MKKKVLFLTNIPSPYRVDFFNELGKSCDLTVLFEKNSSDERDSSWKNFSFENFNGVFLKGKSAGVDMAFCPSVTKYISKDYDCVFVTDFLSPTGMLAIEYMRRKKIEYYLESDGGFARAEQGLKSKIKTHFIKGAKGYFSTSVEHDKYYLQYGADEDKLIRYPFSSVRESDIIPSPISAEEKQRLRIKLGINEKKVVLAAGQFIPRKGFDVLLKAMADIPKDIGVYFVGGKPGAEYLEIVNELKLDNAHFIGFKERAELSDYYKSADLFVLPTREDIWGLVVNEALAYGLPVVTTNKCLAGVEIIKDGLNGFVVEADNVSELAEALNHCYERRSSFSSNCIASAKEYTIEKMAQKHLELMEASK